MTDPAVSIKDLSFAYKDTEQGFLKDLNLEIERGQTVLICGGSGCGKTTITRLVNGLIPHYYEGSLQGEVRVNGIDTASVQIEDLAGTVGSVFQNPRSQFFCVDTTSEIAFGCENMNLPEDEIRKRIAGTAREMNIEDLLDRNIFKLSGGEKQKIACASVSAMLPDIIVMDEPTSNLDIDAIEELKEVIRRWKTQGKTILIAEHRLGWLKGICDRVIVMADGKVEEDLTADEFFSFTSDDLTARGLRDFTPKVDYLNTSAGFRSCDGKPLTSEGHVIHLDGFTYKYGNRKALNIDHLEIPEGAVVAVVGHNGAGKSTFANCLSGNNRHFKGKVTLNGKAYSSGRLRKITYLVMQDVNRQLFAESVLEEIYLGMREDDEKKALEVLSEFDLEEYKDRHPMSLSGGQKQRVAIASALVMDKPLLILDEPTSGLDHRQMVNTSKLIAKIRGRKTVFIITHDMELISRCCTHVLHIEKGELKDEQR